MAMMKCPECGQEISDKAHQCVHCGKVFSEEPVFERRCPECGKILDEGTKVCPNCGCPVNDLISDETQKVEVTNVKLVVDKKKIKWMIVFLILICVVVALVFGVKTISANKEKQNYTQNYRELVSLMLSGASKAESAGSLIHDVWANTIYEEDDSKTDKYTKDSDGKFYDDFNTSLMILMIDDDFTADIDSIKENQEEVQLLMKDMKNPPEEYVDAYDTLKEFYDAYTKLVNLAVSPSGNLSGYTTNLNDADSETLNAYKATLLYMED